MFAIDITSPTFVATTLYQYGDTPLPGTLEDPVLYLFDSSGYGLYSNDDAPYQSSFTIYLQGASFAAAPAASNAVPEASPLALLSLALLPLGLMARRSMARRSMARRSMARRSMAKRSMAKRSMAKRSMAKRSMASRSVARRA